MPLPDDRTPPERTRVGDDDVTHAPGGAVIEAGGWPVIPPYEMIAELGRGGMGTVYRARDPRLKRELAIKVLLHRHVSDPGLRRRFVEEAQISGQLQHPNIIPIHEFGTLPDGRPYFAMKLVKGRTLAALLKERPDPSHKRTRFLDIFEEVAKALAYAHHKNVVHRDLKPANVMIGFFDEVQVMDWGLGKVLKPGGRTDTIDLMKSQVNTLRTDNPQLEQTQMGALVGTFPYMAPEQALGRVDKIDRRTDVFGLGAMLCVILSGKPPYQAPGPEAVLSMAARAEQMGLRDRLAACGADPELVQLVKDCLSPERDGRPAHAGVVVERLTAYRAGVAERLQKAEVERALAQMRADAERRRRTVATAVAAAILLVLIVTGVVLWSRGDRRGQAEQEITEQVAAAETNRDSGRWAEALGQAEKAVERLNGGDVSASFRSQWADRAAKVRDDARQHAAELTTEQEYRTRQAEADKRLLTGLAEARAAGYDLFGYADTEAALAAALRGDGLDVDARSADEIGKSLSGRPAVTAEIVAALEMLSRERQRHNKPADAVKRPLDAANAADPDPTRVELRSKPPAAQLVRLLDLARPEKAGDPNQAKSTTLLVASLLEQAGKVPEARAALRVALRLHPDDLWLNYGLGESLLLQKPERADEAVRYLLVARALRPEVGALLGHAWARLRRLDEALAVYSELVKLRPDSPTGYLFRGLALAEMDRLGEAEREVNVALAKDPAFALGRAGLGHVLWREGKTPEAEAAYAAALKDRPNLVFALEGQARILLDAKTPAEAEKILRQAQKEWPDSTDSRFLLGVALAAQNKDDEAFAEFETLFRQCPRFEAIRPGLRLRADNADYWYGLGSCLWRALRYAEAAEAYRVAVKRRPDSAKNHFYLGRVLLDQGVFAEARIELAAAVKRTPEGDADLDRRKRAVKDCDQLKDLAPQLMTVLAGGSDTFEGDDLIRLADYCWKARRSYYAGYRCFQKAFDADNSTADSGQNSNRYNAACAAVMAAAGQGIDAAALDAKTRSDLRAQALTWLRADLAYWDKKKSEAQSKAQIASHARTWQWDSDLAWVRDPTELENLSEAERTNWRKFWDDVAAMLKAVQ